MGRAIGEEPSVGGDWRAQAVLESGLKVAGHLLSDSFLLPYLIPFIYTSRELFPLPGRRVLHLCSEVTGSLPLQISTL